MMNKDNEFNDLIWKGIELSSNFREDFVDEHKLENFMALLDAVLNLLADSEAEFSTPGLQQYQKCFLAEKGDTKSLFTNTLDERTLAWRRKKPAEIILYNSLAWKEKLKEEDERILAEMDADTNDSSPIDGIWADMDKFITRGTMNQFNKALPEYYKNFMKADDQKKFEEMLEFIVNELTLYSLNYAYVSKILPALDEYRKNGIYPTQTIFMNHYLTMAILDMVSVAGKMFSVTDGNKSFGFAYLKNWLSDNYRDIPEVRSVMGDKNLKSLMKQGESYRARFEDVRNHYIAHYDPGELDVLKKFKVEKDDLEKIYDLCVNVLERLSFKYFHRKLPQGMLIKEHGFSAICKNPWVSMVKRCDLDDFLEVLKKSEVSAEQNKE